MDNLIATILDAIERMPWLLLAAAAVLTLLTIVIMSAIHASAKRRWQQEGADQIDRYETVSSKVRELNDRLDEKDKEIARLTADAQAWVEERAALDAQGNDLNARIQEQDKALEERADEIVRLRADGALWVEERAELTERNQALNAELAEVKGALEKKAHTLDQLYADQDSWNRQRDEILAGAHETAERIVDEASRRLAESEEEVRKNRLVAASTLDDARRRISDMLLCAAGELSKGLPTGDNGKPIGFAPVYSIEEQEVSHAAQEKAADDQ